MEDGALTLREKAEVGCLELGARHAFQLKGRSVFQMPALCDSLRSETTGLLLLCGLMLPRLRLRG